MREQVDPEKNGPEKAWHLQWCEAQVPRLVLGLARSPGQAAGDTVHRSVAPQSQVQGR